MQRIPGIWFGYSSMSNMSRSRCRMASTSIGVCSVGVSFMSALFSTHAQQYLPWYKFSLPMEKRHRLRTLPCWSVPVLFGCTIHQSVFNLNEQSYASLSGSLISAFTTIPVGAASCTFVWISFKTAYNGEFFFNRIRIELSRA